MIPTGATAIGSRERVATGARFVAQFRWSSNRNVVWVTNVLQAVTPYLTTVALGHRFGLGAAGEFALGQALSLPCFQLLSLQLRVLLLTHTRAEIPLSRALLLRGVSTIAGIAVVACLYIFGGPIAFATGAARLADSWTELIQADAQRAGQAWCGLWGTLARAACMAAFVLMASSATTALIGYLTASLLVLAVWETRMPWATEGEDGGVRSDNQMPLPQIVRTGSTLGFAIFLQAVQASTPRLALERMSSAEALGLLATASVVMQAGNVLASSYGQSILMELAQASRGKLAWLVLKPGLAALVALPALLISGDWLLVWLGGERAANSHAVWLAMNIAQVFVWPAAVVGCALTARRHYQVQIPILGSTCVVSLAASLVLIPTWGAVGATWVLGVNAAFLLGVALWFLFAREKQ